jgi:AraC family transcriptional regulator, transcriptional activator of pobA
LERSLFYIIWRLRKRCKNTEVAVFYKGIFLREVSLFFNMKWKLRDARTGGDLLLFKDEEDLDRLYYGRDHANKYFTIAWNIGDSQQVNVDGIMYEFLPHSVMTLLFNQSFHFDNPATVVAWQFNREFYCILDHDAEVSCVGFLFGSTDHLFIHLDDAGKTRLQLILDVFVEEFKTADNIQNDMLLMLLKRLIIFITRLARSEYIPEKKLQDERFHIVRKFNLLVEANYRTEHSVSYYAQQLYKSPKTLSNLFAIYNHKTPSQVIQERILIEARRLLSYTDKPVKEIAYELGFEDLPYFSNFFKKHTRLSPVDFRNKKEIPVQGK